MQQFEKAIKSESGVTIYSYKNPAVHSFYISLFVKAGVMYENADEYGITHFFEHTAIRNVNKLYGLNLYSNLDRFGLEFNASTFSEMVQFYVSGASSNFSKGAEIITKILNPVILDKSEIESERKRIKAEIRESDEKTSLASFTNKIVFEGTSLSASIVGCNKTIDKISKSKLEEYRKKILTKENMFFYVTGNFDDSDIQSLCMEIEKFDICSSEERKNIAPVPNGFLKRGESVHVKNADFSMVRFTFDIDMSRYSIAETDLIYDLLLSGYNSKLFVEMSEKRGLFYDINGALERYENIGTIYFSYEVKEKDVYDSIAIAVDVLNQIKAGNISESECMKAGYVDNAYMLYDDSRELNFTFAYDNHIMGEKYLSVDERKNRYENITANRISEVATEIFRLENLTLTMKGKVKKTDKEKINKILRRLS